MRRVLALAFVLVAWSTGCSFSFSTQIEGETQIPGNPSPLPVLLDVFPGLSGFSNLDFSQNQELQNQGATKEQVQSVKVKSFVLQILSPQTQDFSFLDTLRFYASAQGQPELLLAEKEGIAELSLPLPNPTLSLDVKDVQLQPYVVAPTMSITVQGTGRAPEQTTTLKATVTLDLTVRP